MVSFSVRDTSITVSLLGTNKEQKVTGQTHTRTHTGIVKCRDIPNEKWPETTFQYKTFDINLFYSSPHIVEVYVLLKLTTKLHSKGLVEI